jgi:ribosomal protein S18 acetylase RimI-like enzyme
MVNIRPLQKGEEWFLREMLYEAMYIFANERPLPQSVVDLPELAQYIANFGREGDICYVGEQNGALIGAIWSRLFSQENKGYGFVNEQTPEVSLALKPAFRGKGIGTKLIEVLGHALQQQGYEQISLSVDKCNRAESLYTKLGFKAIAAVESAYTMVKQLQ